jgi:PAS domain S-box-containing protein
MQDDHRRTKAELLEEIRVLRRRLRALARGGASLDEELTEAARGQAEADDLGDLLASLMQAAPVALGVVRHRVMLHVNERMCQMLGYRAAELVGQSARLLYPDDREFERVGAQKFAAMAARGMSTLETRWLTRDGRTLDILLSSAPLDPTDLERGATFTALDITEKRAFEARVAQAQKLESLGVLSGGIAHDFNNLLVGILGNADLALEDLPAHSPARPCVQDVAAAARRAADLVRQLMAYAGRGRFLVERVQLNDVLQEMDHLLQVSVSKKAVLKIELAPCLPAIEADQSQLRQVIMNLVTNASEAIGERSGVIAVRTGAMDCDAAYLRETYLDEGLKPGVYVYVEVSDTGCGMDRDARQRVFDPFFSTKFAGRGLGLAAVLGIVRGHHGAIKIYTELGRGTTFKALFPAVPAITPLHAPPAACERQACFTGTVLLVDDEETVRAVAGRMLARLGFEVVTAEDGRQALEQFRAEPDRFRVIILDLSMPHLDGEETFRELRRIRKDVKVLLSSGYNEAELVTRFAGKGLAGFLQKPYQLSALETKLRELLG